MTNTEINDVGGWDLLDVWSFLWSGRGPLFAITAIFVLLGLIYSFTAQHWYRAEVSLVPSSKDQAGGLGGQLGGFAGLAGLAGISVGGSNSDEAFAVLQSRSLLTDFILQNNLLPILLADEFQETQSPDNDVSKSADPDIRDAIILFEDKRRVTRDVVTGVVKLTIEWKDPDLASQWANGLVSLANSRMRQAALHDADTNIAYLESQLQTTSVLALQQAISGILQQELQRKMLAQGDSEFSFRFVDKAEPPKYRIWPRRGLIVMVATTLGFVMALLCLLLVVNVREARHARSQIGAQ